MGILDWFRGDKVKQISPTLAKSKREWVINVVILNPKGNKVIKEIKLQEGNDTIEIGRHAGHPESDKKKWVTFTGDKILIADIPETQHISRKQATLTWNPIQNGYMLRNHSKGQTYIDDRAWDYGPVRHLEKVSLGDISERNPFVFFFLHQSEL